jgi:Uma2 family endonuclease
MATQAPEGVLRYGSMTLDEWGALREDEPGELVDGKLVEEEVSNFTHEVVVGWLIHVIRTWLAPRGGWVVGSDFKYAVSAERGRKPDVSVYLPSAAPPRGAASVARRPPSIMVEVISPSARDERRDRIDKRAEYAAFGVQYYWLLDPDRRVLEVFELGGDGRYVVALSASNGAHEVPGCPGLGVDLDELWNTIDALPPGED